MAGEKGFCKICGQRVLGKIDRSRPSERVEWKGVNWTEAKPTFMPMFPSLPPGDLCFYHEKKKEETGRESKNTLTKLQKGLLKYSETIFKKEEKD